MTLSAEVQNIRKALDSSAIVAITDPKGIIKYVNDRFVEISQYSEAELLGQNHRIIKSGVHSKEFFHDLWSTILQGKKWEGDICNRAKDGSLYWVHTIIVPFTNSQGQIVEFISIRWEITQLKKTEAHLLETKENLQSLIDASFEGLAVYDLSGRVRWCNASAEKILGLTQDGILNSPVESLLGPQYSIFVEGLQEISVTLPDSPRLLEIATRPYLHKQHRAYLVSFRDITEKARMESKIIQQERLASVGILASGLAHEVGTPLGIMRGRAEMMSMIPDVPNTVSNGAQIIIQQIDRISHLIQNLLKLARGQKEEQLQPVHILSLLSDVDDFLEYELKKHHIRLEVEVPDSFELLGVYNALFQVTLNLLVNATHAIQDRQKSEPNLQGRIHVWAEAHEDFKVLHFEDNGCGMTDETLHNLFTPFYTTKEVGKGTGLGLATSYKIVQSWGGFLSVSSEPNKGTTLSIHIPRGKI